MEVPTIVTSKDLYAQGTVVVLVSRTPLILPMSDKVLPVSALEVANLAEDGRHLAGPGVSETGFVLVVCKLLDSVRVREPDRERGKYSC